MSTLADINYDSLFCLFKGEPGLRKSGCALSFPKPQYWFDWDQKMEALGRPMRAWGVKPTDVSYDSYSNWSDALKQLEKFQVDCKFKTIVIDSITSCADAINRQTLKIKGGKGEGGKMVAGIPVNSIEDFNAEDSALKELIARLKDIHKFYGVNVILIAHVIQKDIKTPDGKTHVSRTLVTAGKGIAQKIPAYCGEVYHFNIKTGFDASAGGQYALLTEHTGDDFARSSLELPGEIVFGTEPLYDKWLKPAIDKMKLNTNKPSGF